MIQIPVLYWNETQSLEIKKHFLEFSPTNKIKLHTFLLFLRQNQNCELNHEGHRVMIRQLHTVQINRKKSLNRKEPDEYKSVAFFSDRSTNHHWFRVPDKRRQMTNIERCQWLSGKIIWLTAVRNLILFLFYPSMSLLSLLSLHLFNV